MRVYNFSAGPSILNEEVLKSAQRDLLDYQGSGMSVMEMSHRSKAYDGIHNEAMALLRELMNVPENYQILFLQGGASQQFDAIPLNLMTNGKADYLVTGNFSGKAQKAAQRYGEARIVASSKESNFTYIPKPTREQFTPDASYTHICMNNTIFGSKFYSLPNTPSPIVCDMSSCILSEEVNVSDYAMIYAGAQKNVGPSGLTIVIIRKDLIGKQLPICPTMLAYQTQADTDSLYNTPCTWATYVAMLTFRWLKGLGGLKAINRTNVYKAKMLYDFIDSSDLYKNQVVAEDRSIMNVPFVTGDKELDAKFVKEAEANGLVSLKGHKLVGGMRASIYNAMPVEGVEALISFMKKFELANK